ncbi:DUF1801 domain-containing protein [uncultured Pontibacter sp.]|uniref:iron chaperone n=1 Tax=uncultured Pontibacter sp. TaxID=453356 RepID=UPI002619991C|nr:DUF1801 domain-containing protein [uncultured Pontibacter sp.]
MKEKYQTVDQYIACFAEDTQQVLCQLRAIVKEKAPGATEGISYGMPAYKTNGKPLVYFAAFKKHIGFYATPSGHTAFAAELAKYKQGKGSVQFPLNQPIPLNLIAEMVAYRVEENNKGNA